ncbi:lectin protein kinase family protein, partial [Striga asiatica]
NLHLLEPIGSPVHLPRPKSPHSLSRQSGRCRSKRAPQPRYGLGHRPFRLDLESLRGRAPCPNEHHHKSESKNHLLVVDLVVLWNLDFSDPNYNHVGVDMNSAKLAAVATVGY